MQVLGTVGRLSVLELDDGPRRTQQNADKRGLRSDPDLNQWLVGLSPRRRQVAHLDQEPIVMVLFDDLLPMGQARHAHIGFVPIWRACHLIQRLARCARPHRPVWLYG